MKIFGIVSVTKAGVVEKDIEEIKKQKEIERAVAQGNIDFAEKVAKLQVIITGYVHAQFTGNDIPPSIACMILESVLLKYKTVQSNEALFNSLAKESEESEDNLDGTDSDNSEG